MLNLDFTIDVCCLSGSTILESKLVEGGIVLVVGLEIASMCDKSMAKWVECWLFNGKVRI